MKKKNNIFNLYIALVASVLSILSACSEDDGQTPPDQSRAVQFSMAHTAIPKSRVADGNWEATDRIGIYMVETGKTLSATTIAGEAENRKYKPTKEEKTAAILPDETDQTIYYPANAAVDFIAYYPWKATGTATGEINNFQYPIDLSTQVAAPLLVSRNAIEKDKNSGQVALNFKPALTRLVMTLKAGNGLTGTDIAGITATALVTPLTANYSLVDGTITSIGSSGTVSLDIRENSGIYITEAIIFPGSASGRKVTFTLPPSAGGDNISWNIPADMDFTAGVQYNYTLTLDRTSVKTETFTISDWKGVDSPPVTPPYVPESWSDPNCYIIATVGGSVEIPVRKAYDIWRYHPFFKDQKVSLSGELTAELVWMDNPGLIDVSSDALTITGEDYNAKINVKAATGTGNAVIAARIGEEIRWSWHIWVTGENVPKTTYIYNNGNRDITFMDRNLGAMNDEKADAGSKGLLYQWGRKDPFVGSSGWTNANSVIMYNAEGEINASTTPPTGAAFQYGIFTKSVTTSDNANIAAAVTQPNVMYVYVDNPWGENTDELWGNSGDKSPFDPCPKGWRVPTFMNDISPWKELDVPDGQTPDDFNNNKGHDWGATLGYYPAAGYRSFNPGGLSLVGSNGSYWSSTNHGASSKGYLLNFYSTEVHTQYSYNRSYGFSVRCVSSQN